MCVYHTHQPFILGQCDSFAPKICLTVLSKTWYSHKCGNLIWCIVLFTQVVTNLPKWIKMIVWTKEQTVEQHKYLFFSYKLKKQTIRARWPRNKIWDPLKVKKKLFKQKNILLLSKLSQWKFGVCQIFLCFWMKYLILTKAAVIWSQIQ